MQAVPSVFRIQLVLTLVLALLLAGCETVPSAPESRPLTMPELATAGTTRYVVDPERSVLTLRVYREGPLARFGHNHVIAATRLQGEVYRHTELIKSGFRLVIPVVALVVDRPSDRKLAGPQFAGDISAQDIEATRNNMLGPDLLQADDYPEIEVRTLAVRGNPPDVSFIVRVKVRDVVSEWDLPAHLTMTDRRVVADGVAVLSQTQLGLTPFSVMGGGLRVADNIEVHYHVEANQVVNGLRFQY